MTQPAPVFDDLETLREAIAEQGRKRVVLASGRFDPLHVAHVRYLVEAGSHGEFLVVAVAGGQASPGLEGGERPVVAGLDRAAIVAALDMVHAVYLFGDADLAPALEILRPDVYASGADEGAPTAAETETSHRLGIDTVITSIPTSHASRETFRKIRGGSGE